MRRELRRYGPVLGVVAAALLVVGVNLTVAWLGREPSNYAQVEEGLYLGGYVRQLPRGVTAVLNLCETEDPYRAAAHRWEPIRDGEPAPTLDWLRQQVRFIENQRGAGRSVFVHCRSGVSRSGLVVAAYLMARHGWTRDEAQTFLRSRRALVRPNPAFLPLLREWEQALEGERGADSVLWQPGQPAAPAPPRQGPFNFAAASGSIFSMASSICCGIPDTGGGCL